MGMQRKIVDEIVWECGMQVKVQVSEAVNVQLTKAIDWVMAWKKQEMKKAFWLFHLN